MAISDDIRAAIDKNLSAEVGNVLKTRLDRLEDVEAKLRQAYSANESLVAKGSELEKALSKLGDLDTKIKQLQEAEEKAKKATIDQAICDLRTRHAQEMVTVMERVVTAVFSNSKFKYTAIENGNENLPIAYQGGGSGHMSMPINKTKTVEGEGPVPTP